MEKEQKVKCESCGNEFKQNKDWQKFCSKKCGNHDRMERYWKKRVAAMAVK